MLMSKRMVTKKKILKELYVHDIYYTCDVNE